MRKPIKGAIYRHKEKAEAVLYIWDFDGKTVIASLLLNGSIFKFTTGEKARLDINDWPTAISGYELDSPTYKLHEIL